MEEIAPFRYSLVMLGITYPVSPIGVEGVKLKSEKEGENIFHRRKLSGTLTFVKGDFALLHSVETSAYRCQEVLLNIDRFCQGAYVPEWQGVFSLNEVKWDLSKCTAEVTPRPNDAYRQVLDYYTKEFNILQLPATDTVRAQFDYQGQFEFYAVGTAEEYDTLPDSDTWQLFLSMNYWIKGTLLQKGKRNRTQVYFRLVLYRDTLAGEPVDLSSSGWVVVDESAATTKYAKAPDIYNFSPYKFNSQADFTKYRDLLVVECASTDDAPNYVLVANQNHDEGCFDLRKSINNDVWVKFKWEFGAFYFDRNRQLLHVIKHLLHQTSPSVEPLTAAEISEFFSADTNYVTGHPNALKGLLLAQKSDILSWNSSEPATKGMLSLKNLLDDLAMFGVKWFINGSGKFQIEHPAYFERLEAVDLRPFPLLRGNEAYSYETDKMPRFEKLTFVGYLNEDFGQGVIEYAGACVIYTEGQDTNETTISRFVTDLEYLMVSSGSDRNGFVLLTQEAGQVKREAGAISGKLLANAHLAAANLVQHYFTHNRVLPAGLVNGLYREFVSTRRTRKQVDLTVPACCGTVYHPFAEYITNLGADGELLSAEFDFKSQNMVVSIAFPVTGTGTKLRQFDDSFSASFS